MVSILTPCGFHVDTTWLSHEHHMVSRWIPHDMDTMWCPGNHMVSMWTQHVYHMNTTLFPGGYHIVSMWIPCGFHVDTMCFSGGHHVVFRWKLHGFKCGHHMVSRWTLHGFHRTPHGLHMDTMWCPGNHMETSTNKQLCMKPTGFLVFYVQVPEECLLIVHCELHPRSVD